MCLEAARPLPCQQGHRRRLRESGAGCRRGEEGVGHQHLGGTRWGKGLAVPAFARLGASTQPGSPVCCSPSTKKSSRKNKIKIKTNNPQVAEALEGSEGRAATCPSRQRPWLPALLLPARLSPLSLRAAVSHVRLPAHGRLAAPCRHLLLASASSPLPWQLGPASFTRSPRPAGRPPGCWGGRRWEPV